MTIFTVLPSSTASASNRRLLPRADSTTKSSSSSSSRSSSSTSSSSNRKPADANQSTAVIVAVVVPVVVVGVILAFVLWKVWQRGKKEAREDDDPDFDGDGLDLPSIDHTYQMRERSMPGTTSDSNFDDLESKGQSHVMTSYQNPLGHKNFPLDPFHLPNGDDTEELRSFARSIQNRELDGYRLASQNPSEISLSRPNSEFQKPQVLARNQRANSFTSSNMHSVESVPNWANNEEDQSISDYKYKGDQTTQISQDIGDSTSEIESSPIKHAHTEVQQGFVTNSVGLDPEKSARDSRSFSIDAENFADPIHDVSSREVDTNIQQDENDEYLTSKEEENIKRMKSIYEVYLDRNGTVRTLKPSSNGEAGETEPISGGFAASESLPAEAVSKINHAAGTQKALESQFNASGTFPFEEQVGLQVPDQEKQKGSGRRAVSSIYSEMPTYPPQSAQPEYNQEEQPIQENSQLQYQPQYQPQYPTQYQHQYPAQYYNDPNTPQAYANEAYAPQQYYHPQALENIEELPNPSNLPFSASTSSLTSYKKVGKSLFPGGMSTYNGTSLNPIDHPELFYNQMSGANDSQSGIGQETTGHNQILPHHLRQSIVMTNPADLTFAKLHKPAGSFRNISAANSRNNSMTSQHSIQQYQSQLAHQRVSGILDDHEVMHPPKMGGILPHNGSHDDLRRQLGSSDNYNVS
ncbi:LANO_0F16072g1_1 [Lachancea nothofagi CBS 11611]|uniref:LANO_0F16072g1_1 n=1 Tax=Lachancea nothofagi CBS 11611 TaxID=1266666 RepID=A0A1G4KCP7_9SACH|nr:LANO_0F16072g1_1 [Lachancea nothofagi CBS 11611]